MTTFLATVLLFGLAFGGLALGTMLGREPIKGSCGGLGRLGIAKDCSCESPCPRRRRELERLTAAGREAET
jgi:hypothetical protein